MSAVYKALGMRLTQKKLAQAVPIVGVVIGAGLNARALARVVDEAEHLYMERFLRDKYGIPVEADEPHEAGGIVDVIDAEIVDPADEEGLGESGTG